MKLWKPTPEFTITSFQTGENAYRNFSANLGLRYSFGTASKQRTYSESFVTASAFTGSEKPSDRGYVPLPIRPVTADETRREQETLPYSVQITAMPTQERALGVWNALAQKEPTLKDYGHEVVEGRNRPDRSIYLMRVGPFAGGQKEAENYCSMLKEKHKADCYVPKYKP